jgi:hypothetical protein
MPKTTEVSLSARRKPRTTKRLPTTEEIQLRAYEIYVERNGAPGNELDDWVEAERQLFQKSGPKKSRKTARATKAKTAQAA